jgi:hypothetical protein
MYKNVLTYNSNSSHICNKLTVPEAGLVLGAAVVPVADPPTAEFVIIFFMSTQYVDIT